MDEEGPRTLADALGERQGWRLERNGVPVRDSWCFGLEGAARLVVTEGVDGYVRLYMHESDAEHGFETPAELVAWLDVHETEYEGFTPLQRELGGEDD
jgi:hypothetical protein